jgi:hypothetical protein
LHDSALLMAQKSITYTMYSPGDEKGIIELLCVAFPGWKAIKDPLAYWTWKYLEGPNPSLVGVAKDGKRVVGVNHRLMLDYKIGHSIIRSSYGDDVAVSPEYREFGIWKNLKKFTDGKNIENGIKFGYLATENPIVKDNMVKMGYTASKHYLSHLLVIRDQETFLKKKQKNTLVMRVGVSALAGWSKVKQRLTSGPAKTEEFSIINVAKFDQRMDVFWNRVKNSYDYCIVKNTGYLNWKHSRPWASERMLKLALKDDEVLGFSVLDKLVDGEYCEGSISDLLTLPDRTDVANALIGDACEYFSDNGVAAIYFQATKGHPYEGLAKQNGFIDASSQSKTYFYYRVIGDGISVDYLENLPPSRVQLNYF